MILQANATVATILKSLENLCFQNLWKAAIEAEAEPAYLLTDADTAAGLERSAALAFVPDLGHVDYLAARASAWENSAPVAQEIASVNVAVVVAAHSLVHSDLAHAELTASFALAAEESSPALVSGPGNLFALAAALAS